MALDALLSRSAALEQTLGEFFALPLFDSSSRLQASQMLVSVAFEHACSLKHLVAAGLYTSASALLRVQYEALVRAMWILYVATDGQADLMVSELTHESAKKANRMPMLSEMLDDIEKKAPHAPLAHLREFKSYSWQPLSSFVHGGIHAINRHGYGFPQHLVETMIRHSNGLLGIAGNLVLILAGVPPGNMAAIYAEFHDCLPMANQP